LVGLTVLLLSDRIQRQVNRFVSKHLKRPDYDYQQVWSTFTERTASLMDATALCRVVVSWISETFHVLSVTIWVADDQQEQLSCCASTSIADVNLTKVIKLEAEAAEILQAVRHRS